MRFFFLERLKNEPHAYILVVIAKALPENSHTAYIFGCIRHADAETHLAFIGKGKIVDGEVAHFAAVHEGAFPADGATKLEQRKVVETSSSAWKADVLTVIRPLHVNPAYKALLHSYERAGNNSKGDQQTVRNHSMTVVPQARLKLASLSASTPKIDV